MPGSERALIVGAGSGLSASLARRAAREGMDVVLAARDTQKLAALTGETGATAIACDATRAADVERLFAAVDAGGEQLDLVIYNASGRARGPVTELDPEAVENAIRVTAFGGFLVARAAAQRMSGRATASCSPAPAPASRDTPRHPLRWASSPCAACAKLARLQPQNILSAIVIVAGSAGRGTRAAPIAAPMRCSIRRDRRYLFPSASPTAAPWAWEIELRPGRRSEAKNPVAGLVPATLLKRHRRISGGEDVGAGTGRAGHLSIQLQ